jgi:hypothetical protein
MNDRRAANRRSRNLVSEPLTRRSERRGDERRDFPRRQVALDVWERGQRARSCMGNLSVGGASFVTSNPPAGDVVRLRFSIPSYVGPIEAIGVVVSRSSVERGTQVSVVFTELELDAELAIAQWFDELNGAEVAWVQPEGLSSQA